MIGALGIDRDSFFGSFGDLPVLIVEVGGFDSALHELRVVGVDSAGSAAEVFCRFRERGVYGRMTVEMIQICQKRSYVDWKWFYFGGSAECRCHDRRCLMSRKSSLLISLLKCFNS